MINKLLGKQHVQVNKPALWGKVSLWGSAIFLIVLFFAAGQPVADNEPITLLAEQMPFTPKEYYISEVIDERENRTAVAWLFPDAVGAAQSVKTRSVDLQGGGLTAIRQFIWQGTPRNVKLRPVVVRLKECRVTETVGDKGRVDGKVIVAMAFDLQGDGERIPLLEYKGGARYNRPASHNTVVEPSLRQSLVEALKYLNTWMDHEANSNPKLAKGIKVSFTDYAMNPVNDTVFYALNRPLVWDDFRAAPRAGRYAAAVFPSFAYEGETEVINGIIHLNLTLKVYVLQHSSWVKANAKDAYGLNHEQRHFDIAKLVAERFRKKIQPENLTVADYNSIIQYEYIESFREMNHLQEQYDEETQHGINQVAQQQWNQRIDEELKVLSVKK
ncbi:hypothetical protein ACFSKU_18615 [Pontibacter silvestris]|uniref:DUF922 domain-containing protein n=1 Tax=Pontibacter silvestris TaxID=2305183 RepID=A0ABW4X2L2_9BACT|nr:hypothetical protein [Pontibacter silvestris]MCC9135095.1 hypothetical protein [Pontibacter silvestris]